MPNRGSVNRRTGKTTPRGKARTHWGKKGSARRLPTSGKAGKPAASRPPK